MYVCNWFIVCRALNYLHLWNATPRWTRVLAGLWSVSFLKIAQGFLGRAESKTVSVDISCYLACSHGCTPAADAPGTRAWWRRSKSLIRAGSCYRPDRNARQGELGNRVWSTLTCLGLQVALVFVGLSSFPVPSPQASFVPDWTQEVLKPHSRKVISLFCYMGLVHVLLVGLDTGMAWEPEQ